MAAVDLPEVDVAIAGGGPVGCALALALSDSAVPVARISDEAAAADRPIALSYGSRLILEIPTPLSFNGKNRNRTALGKIAFDPGPGGIDP